MTAPPAGASRDAVSECTEKYSGRSMPSAKRLCGAGSASRATSRIAARTGIAAAAQPATRAEPGIRCTSASGVTQASTRAARIGPRVVSTSPSSAIEDALTPVMISAPASIARSRS